MSITWTIPVIVCSFSLDGGVCDGVWWCDEPSPRPDADKPPYNALKSSGVLLHFRFWCKPEFLPLLSKLLPVMDVRRSCDKPNNRFSCDEMPIKRLSCNDINFVSWWPPCCKLPWANAWSSSKPCCNPNKPPTKFGLNSSISLFVCPLHEPAVVAVVKFNCLLNIAGKILNCCDVSDGLDELMLKFWPPVVEMDVVLLPPLPPAPQWFLKSNLWPPNRCCFWAGPGLLSRGAVRSVDRYSLKLLPTRHFEQFDSNTTK